MFGITQNKSVDKYFQAYKAHRMDLFSIDVVLYHISNRFFSLARYPDM